MTIQPHGALLVYDMQQDRILAHSANAGGFTGLGKAIAPGASLTALMGQPVVHDLRNAAAKSRDGQSSGMVFGLHLANAYGPFDVMVHEDEGHLIVEFEPDPPPEQAAPAALELARRMIRRIGQAEDATPATLSLLQAMLGFDRVRLYRQGRLVASSSWDEFDGPPALDSCLVDPPPDRPRLIGDIHADSVPMIPAGPDTDLTLARLRSASPAQREAMLAMGAASALCLPAGEDALFTCHGRMPKVLPVAMVLCAEIVMDYLVAKLGG